MATSSIRAKRRKPTETSGSRYPASAFDFVGLARDAQSRGTVLSPGRDRSNMSTDCTFCESDVDAHDPVFVETKTDGERERAGQFCNYACLSAWIDAEGKVRGTRASSIRRSGRAASGV